MPYGLYTAVPPAIQSQGVSQGVGTMPIGLGLGLLISGLIGGGTSLLGGKMQSNAASRAQQASEKANAGALEFEKARDKRDYEQYMRELDRAWRIQDEDRGRGEEMRQLSLLRDREREGRLAPFRQGAERGYQALSSLLTLPEGGMQYAAPVGNTGRLKDLL